MDARVQNETVQVMHATPEFWGSMMSCPTAPSGMAGAKMVLVMAPGWETMPAMGIPPVARFVFRQAGCMCEVVFDGGRMFHMKNTDGAKYLDFVLHHPNEVTRSFNLEQAVKPYKSEARETNSTQEAVDNRTKREAREELLELEAELAEAEAQDLTTKADRLKDEISKIKAIAGNGALLNGDTGERARDNVRKAITKVVRQLRKGSKEEKAFAQHVKEFVSLGHNVVYLQPAGKIWA